MCSSNEGSLRGAVISFFLSSLFHFSFPFYHISAFFTWKHLASMTWYAVEGSPVDEDGFYDTDKPKVDFLFFGWVFNHDLSELGYWSLNMMEAVEVMGLRIERDVNFEPTPLSIVKNWHRKAS